MLLIVCVKWTSAELTSPIDFQVSWGTGLRFFKAEILSISRNCSASRNEAAPKKAKNLTRSTFMFSTESGAGSLDNQERDNYEEGGKLKKEFLHTTRPLRIFLGRNKDFISLW